MGLTLLLRHWVIHRADYQKVLADAAIAAGAEIKFSQRVAAVDSRTRTVTMQDGSTLQGDLIVGADGKSNPSKLAFRNASMGAHKKLNRYQVSCPLRH